MSHFHVTTRLFHVTCGHLVNEESLQCSFCQKDCDGNDDIIRGFHLKITVADKTAKIFAYSSGQTAIELLQISPDEFHELPEEEQVMYPTSLESERFMVALVNCSSETYGLIDNLLANENASLSLEITRALKCE